MPRTRKIVVNQTAYRKRLINTLRRFKVLSRTTTELDNLDLWLAGRPMYFLAIMLTAPIVFVIWALRPLLLIRFGVFVADRIGVFAPTAQGYLLKHQREITRPRTADFIGVLGPISNLQLFRMLTRQIRVLPGAWLWLLFDRGCQFWTRSSLHHGGTLFSLNHFPQFLNYPPFLHFTSSEKLAGENLLQALGVTSDAPWVCIHNRDAEYLNTKVAASKFNPDNSWEYHNYRDFSAKSMLSAAEELTKRGYFILRMGAVVAEPLISTNPKIVDYASTPLRSDFGDIFLLANSAAYLGSDSGIATVPMIFCRPVIYINWPLSFVNILTFQGPLIFITKHLYHRATKRHLGIREVFDGKLLFASEARLYEEAGVDVEDNTPEEICDLAIELDEKLRGTWRPQAQDEQLQRQFWDIFRHHCPPEHVGSVQPRIGAAFLRQHGYLLD